MSKSGPVIGAVAGVLLVVGGVAAAQAFQPVQHEPTPQPSVVQPLVEQPAPTTTTAAPEPVVTEAAKPAKKKAAAVSSKSKASTTSAPRTVQRKVAVTDEITEPEPNATLPGRKTRPNPGRPVGPVVIDPQNPAPDPQ